MGLRGFRSGRDCDSSELTEIAPVVRSDDRIFQYLAQKRVHMFAGKTLAIKSLAIVASSLLPLVLSTKEASAQQNETAYRRSGADVPLYSVVDSYFDGLSWIHGLGSRPWSKALRELNIDIGSRAEGLLRDAMIEAKGISEWRAEGLDRLLGDPEAFEAEQLRVTRLRVHALRRVYFGLCAALEGEGVAISKLERELEEDIRPSISMSSFPDPDYEFFEILAEFEGPPTQIEMRAFAAMDNQNAVLLVGMLPTIVNNVAEALTDLPMRYVGATSAEEVRQKLDNNPEIRLAILGGGLPSDTRGDLVGIIAKARPDVTIHLMDRDSGPTGMASFVRKVATAMLVP